MVDSGQRTALCRRVGELLLPLIAPGEVEGMRAEARKSPRGKGGGMIELGRQAGGREVCKREG